PARRPAAPAGDGVRLEGAVPPDGRRGGGLGASACGRMMSSGAAGAGNEPWSGRRLHFVGVGGTGMSGYARVAHELGASVSGSDSASSSHLERLVADGVVRASIGHAAENLPAGDGVELVYSSAVPADNVERVAARGRGIPERARAELLSQLTELRRTIAVAGTHGKTTTASMLVHALRAAGLEPGWLVGGAVGGDLANASWGRGEWLVVEADESDRSMLSLHVEIAVLTNVELDHHATFASLAELREAFRRFLDAPPLAVIWDRPELLELRSGADATKAIEGLARFHGAGRRFQLLGRSAGGALLYDDYAHHPSEIAATLDAARTLEHRRLVAVFQPHLYSRTALLAREFGLALARADVAVILDVYPARERPEDHPGVSGLTIAEATADAAGGRPVYWLPTFADAEPVLREQLQEGDVCMLMGAGDIDVLGRRLSSR